MGGNRYDYHDDTVSMAASLLKKNKLLTVQSPNLKKYSFLNVGYKIFFPAVNNFNKQIHENSFLVIFGTNKRQV